MYSLHTYYPDSGRLAAPEEQKSLAVELLPFLTLVVGVPMLIWLADRKKQKERGRLSRIS